MLDKLAYDVLAKFKRKKKLENGTVVYMYSEKQIAHRNRHKARRLEKLRKNIKHLRAQVKKDLTSTDPEKALTALAVGLMDETAERVGSPASAAGDLNEDGEAHFGVTTWTKKHISFGKGGATIKYTGKSGVKHVKKVTDAGLVKALRKAADCVGKDDCVFSLEKGTVGGKHVNDYLKTFGITAKDLRGFHANTFMKEQLKAVRSKGGKLPEDKKEREKKLKDEFKEALEKAAEDVGHEPSTLRSQYLIPGLEEEFLKDGTVSDKMTKQAAREPYELVYPVEDGLGRPLGRTATLVTLDQPWVDKMRKDFLTLVKNVPRLKDYNDALRLKQAIRIWTDNFEELFFKQFLNSTLKYNYAKMGLSESDKNYIERKLRKSGWDLTSDFSSMPFQYADNYYSPEARFRNFQNDVNAWDKKVRRKAQVFWKELGETIQWFEKVKFRMTEDPAHLEVEMPDVDQVTLEGFHTVLKGYDPQGSSYMHSALEQIKAALKDYRQKARERLPLLLKKQLPMVIDFQGDLSTGGEYRGKYIWINGTGNLSNHESVSRMTKTLAHEMGHHIYKSLSAEADALWYTLIRGDYGDIDLKAVLDQWPDSIMWAIDFADSLREKDPILSLQIETVASGYQPGGFSGSGVDKKEDFQRIYDSGTTTLRVPSTPITGYAGKNPEEAFCETIGLLVAYGPRAVHEKIRHWLDVVLPGQVKLAALTLVAIPYAPPGVYCRMA